jgi:methionyl-tRNA synthetase
MNAPAIHPSSVKSHKYFTTPIYYASGEAHVGHLYANTLMNVYRNFYHLLGDKTLRLTGLDEHGEKIEEKASELKLTPQDYVNSLEPKWRKVFAEYGLNYDVFVRTTSEEHKKNVQSILEKCHKNGDIYFAEHEGHYCIDCEAFLTDKEMDESKSCLVHKKKTELRKEGNYYFRTTKYYPQIRELLRARKIVRQDRYCNETLAMMDALTTDLSISRPKTRTSWGIELPFDTKHVAYVWFDALPNYVTGIGGLAKAPESEFWKNATHIVGKDILRFHAIYWPAICLAVNIPVPELMVTGWMLSQGHKMSKSLGNVVAPADLLPYGTDAFVNFAMRQNNIGEDFDFNIKVYLERYNADLANGIGNLVSRTFAMIEKYCACKIPAVHKPFIREAEEVLFAKANQLKVEFPGLLEGFHQATALQRVWELIGLTDKFISDAKPWDLAKSETTHPKLFHVLGTAVAIQQIVGLFAWPFFPAKMSELLNACGVQNAADPMGLWQTMAPPEDFQGGFVFSHVPKLCARVDVPKAAEKPAVPVVAPTIAPSAESKVVPAANETSNIEIGDFSKVAIHVGTVVSAEMVEGSDKLLKLRVSLGELGFRQIFSGIRAWITPESLANQKVLVVTNLTPRKMKFGMSEGMVLSADTIDGRVSPVFAPEFMKEGTRLS